MTKQNYTLFFLLGACLWLCLLYCPPYNTNLDDMEVFRYMGLAISKGHVPYRDFFDHKPPLIYFINYAGILLGGPWGLWVINTALTLLATWVCLLRCRQYRLPQPWLIPLLFNLMLRDFIINAASNSTREFTALFFMLFFLVLMGTGRYRDFLLGLLGGLIFFTQQEEVLPLLPFLVYTLIQSEKIKAGERLLRMTAGALAITVPILGYFAANHSCAVFWQDAFQFNFTWYIKEKESFRQHLKNLMMIIDNGNYEMPVMIALTLGITAFFSGHTKKGLLIAALAALVLTLVPEFMGGHYMGSAQPVAFYYYFQPLSASVCILLFVIRAFAGDSVLPFAGRGLRADKRVFWPYAVLLCSSLLFTALRKTAILTPRKDGFIVASPEANYLRVHPPSDYQLYVFANVYYTFEYNEFGILAPSPWIQQHYWQWYNGWDPDQKMISAICSSLLLHRTKYVILDPEKLGSFRNPANAARMMEFMNKYYHRISLPGNPDSILWERND